jgi:hypothetical protein
MKIKTDSEAVELLKKWFTNKNQIHSIKKINSKYLQENELEAMCCMDKYGYIEKDDLCEHCQQRHNNYLQRQALARDNRSIQTRLRHYCKNKEQKQYT